MKKIVLLVVFLMGAFSVFAQRNSKVINNKNGGSKRSTITNTSSLDYVTVDDQTYTPQDLVTKVLINNPCVTITNFSSTKPCGFGYFNQNNSSFPIKEGMIIRNGIAKLTEGKYDITQANASSSCTGDGVTDNDLQAIICPNNSCSQKYVDPSSVQFSFVAGGDKFSFRYLFASNEYGNFQCDYSDAFAFILTNTSKGTPAQNLAVIPGTTIPVSVTNIRQQKYNTSSSTCPDANPTWFGQYNASPAANVAASSINMVGQTKPLIAMADVIPGDTYSIKLVIGDYKNYLFDSAVFIEAGSFDFGAPKIQSANGGPDSLTLCEGSSAVLYSGTQNLKNSNVNQYIWKFNGNIIPNANDYQITITQAGTYTVIYKNNLSGCEQSDDYTVTYAQTVPLQEPNDLSLCESVANKVFDLTSNEAVVLGGQNPSNFSFYYFASLSDAQNYNNVIADPKNYQPDPAKSFPQTIYMVVVPTFGSPSGCNPIKQFNLVLIPTPKGTIQYVDNDNVPGFCINSNNALRVTPSADLTPGGVYSVAPSTGLTIDSTTGTLDLTNAVPGSYVVNYKVAANAGCVEYNTTTNVKIDACLTVTMNPISAVCPGDPVNLTCTDPGLPVTYNWYDSNNVLLASTTVPKYTIAASPVTAGNYNYSVVAQYGTDLSPKSSAVLTVNPKPVVSITGASNVCSGASTVVNFNGTPNAFVTYNDGTNNLSIQLDNTGVYQMTTPNLNADITYKLVSVAGNTTPNCLQNIPNTAANSSLSITVISAPTASVSFGSNSTICEGQATDVVFNGTPNAVVVYTKNGVDQNVTLNASGQPTIVNTGVLNVDTVFTIVSVTSSAATCVGYPSGPDSTLTVTVVQIPQPSMKQKAYICQDSDTGLTTRTCTLQTGLDPAIYSFVWYQGDTVIPGADQSSYVADTVAKFKVVVTDKASGCTKTAMTDVLASIPPTAVLATVSTAYFADNATVVVTATPTAPAGVTYEYSLDFGPFQDSNIFEGVSYGTHEVHVRDKEACGMKTTTVTVIDFPKYFTPNADGYNDIWNILSLNDQTNAKIYIFDRYGKLLKQISPVGAGWDGTYNGQLMPADDYWFVVKYQEHLIDQEFKSHFSLKR